MDGRPELNYDFVDEWNSFVELHATRNVGYGVGPQPIQPSEIQAWLELHCIEDPEMRLWYYDVIRRVDLDYLNHSRSKLNESMNNHSPQKK